MVAGQVGARAAALLSGTALQSDGGAPALVLNGPGEPLGAFIAAWAAVEAGRLVAGRTSLDILVTPTLSVCAGGSAGLLVGPPISRLMISLGQLVNWGTERQPLLMGIIVSALMGIILTLPISSAALGIILDLSGLAAGAATIGCTTQMVGFAVASYRENRFAGLIAQGLGTSMLQVPNIVRHHHHGAGHAVQCHRLGHGFGGARGPDHDLPDNVGLHLHRAAHRPHSRLPDPHPRAADPGDQRAHAGPRLDQTGGHGPGRRLRAAAVASTRPCRANRLNHSQPNLSHLQPPRSPVSHPLPGSVICLGPMAGIKQNDILGRLLRDCWLVFTGIAHEDRLVQIDMTNEERGVLIRWKNYSDTYRLVRMKAEAIAYAARGVGLDIIMEMVERAEKTVRKWLSQWRRRRLSSVVTGHAVGRNAAKLRRAQKEEREEIFNKPPSEAGAWAELWDVPAP